jgi:hypothetical protein
MSFKPHLASPLIPTLGDTEGEGLTAMKIVAAVYDCRGTERLSAHRALFEKESN